MKFVFLTLPYFIVSLASAAEDLDALKFFETKIRPLLSAECYDCHGPEKSKGDLRLDHREYMIEGGTTGPALVPGKPAESLMIEAVHRTDPDLAMPPKKELNPDQIALLEKWITLGAPWPEEKLTKAEGDENGFTKEDKNWWAIKPVVDPAIPASGEGWAKNEIDHFVAQKLDAAKLKPAATADAGELVRRIFFDLHGLPPGSEDVIAFQKAFAENPDKATAALIDRLLESPRYGERWGQHWLDVVRYAESDGYRADDFRPETWMYRDYVVRSYNEDKPYHQFIREQLAADEIAPNDPDILIATAFMRLGIYEWNQRNAKMQWDLILTEMTNVTSDAFLGLGMGCAQCHDHKFDPILQKDYFALQSFFNSTWWPENQLLASPETRAAYDAKTAAWEAATKEIRTGLDGLTGAILERKKLEAAKQFPEDVQAMYSKPAAERTTYEEQLAQLVQRQVDFEYRRTDFKKTFEKDPKKLALYTELTEKLKAFDSLKPAPLPPAFITTDVGPIPAETHLKRRGVEKVIEPAFLTLLGQPAPKITPTASTSGRRTALANWIASKENPFTARVMVNRIWQRHFAEGIVPTPNDFGFLGEAPSHPELLDWLTSRFLDDDWKMKSLHRAIMTSATYRQTARREPMTAESVSDPGNRLLWRFPPQRLDAEQIRDATLAASGELTARDGGPSVDGTAPLRSIYLKKRRNTSDPLMGEFDSTSGFSSSPTRIPTTTPNQSLMLVNGEWSLSRAGAFAKRILKGSKIFGPDQVKEAFRVAYGREALTHEIERSLAFVDYQKGSVPATATATADKFPNETGLRPANVAFKDVRGIELGESALWLQPGSRFETLAAAELTFPDEEFTIEAVANLDNVYADSSVNTLISHWNGNAEEVGWAVGVTSAKSRFDPQNFIVQLVGDDFQKNRIVEVVASGLRVPLNKPVYLAVSISAKPSKEDSAKGSVTFYLKDLSDPNATVQTATVQHQIVGGLVTKPGIPTTIGGRDQKGHHWDGQLARLTASKGVLNKAQILPYPQRSDAESLLPAPNRIVDWKFAGKDGEIPAPGTKWKHEATFGPSTDVSPQLFGAVTDFCHALLNSNEFLYLH